MGRGLKCQEQLPQVAMSFNKVLDRAVYWSPSRAVTDRVSPMMSIYDDDSALSSHRTHGATRRQLRFATLFRRDIGPLVQQGAKPVLEDHQSAAIRSYP